MAKVVAPLHSSEARGKMNGLVYNTWRGLSTVKQHVHPADPATSRQLAWRAFMTTINSHWRALDPSIREEWKRYAQEHPDPDWTGKPKRLTGHQQFVRHWLRNNVIPAAGPTRPPHLAPPEHPGQIFAMSPEPGIFHATWYGLQRPYGEIVYWTVYLDGPKSIARRPEPTDKLLLTAISWEATEIVAWDLAPGYYWMFSRILRADTGQVSPWLIEQIMIMGV